MDHALPGSAALEMAIGLQPALANTRGTEAIEVSTTFSGPLAQLTRTSPERVAVLDWALNKAARMVASTRAAAPAESAPQEWTGAVVAEGRTGQQAYNEEAFRYFLDIEEKRAERSQVPFFLLLINARDDGQSELQLAPAV